MAPVDLFSSALGAEVDYNSETGVVVISREDTTITFAVDDTAAKLNNRNVTLDTPPVIKDGAVYVPLRFPRKTWDMSLPGILTSAASISRRCTTMSSASRARK